MKKLMTATKEQLERAKAYHQKKKAETSRHHNLIDLHAHHVEMIVTIQTRINFLS